jgi:HrpA-like RNA helicase
MICTCICTCTSSISYNCFGFPFLSPFIARRISAISIADRVAQEQNLDAGGLIGYQVRLEGASSKDTQLLFVTPGILLRRLQSSPTLSEFTHIIIDEVHERDKYTEFLLITLRDLLPVRPDLRLILMSATLQTEVLVGYFRDCHDHSAFYQKYPPALVEIEGRTFPVQEFFLEHALQMTEYITPTTNDGDGNGNQSGGVMSMDALEAELAKLTMMGNGYSYTSTQQQQQQQPHKIAAAETSRTMMPCIMCNQSFPDHVALGSHVAVCGGDSIVETTVTVTELPDASPNSITTTEAGDSLLTPGDFEDYDDYDVDATAEVEGYTFHQGTSAVSSTSTQPAPPPPQDTTAGAVSHNDETKWDGKGLFAQDHEILVDVTPDQENILDQYQAMHDDEQVDTSLLLEVLHYINKLSYGDGAILVFLPGWQEISEFKLLLECSAPFHDRARFVVLPLHSGIPSSEQRKVLQRPPKGMRKIVLSTNIAETSLTIDDVAFVVDSGRAKEKDYDPHLKTSTLQPTWISQASCKQRKGRAGRTKAGVCFHLFSSRRYQSLRPFVESELLRTPLEEMCLFTKKLGLAPGGPDDVDGIPAFLEKAISPPHEKSISNALELLVDLGAMLPETNDLTNLGQCLSILSLEPRVGKMVIWSYLLGCTRVAAQMAVAMSYKSPFILPPQNMRRDAEKAQVELSNNSESDQVTVLNAIYKYDQLKKKSPGAYRDFCRRNFLSTSTMQMIADVRKNLTRELHSLNFPDPMMANGYHNRNDKQQALWQAAISAGLYPNVASRKRGDVNFSTMTNRKAKIHVSSVNSVKGQPLNGKCQIPEAEVEFVCFGEMVKGKHFFTLSQTTHLASPLPLLLLCGTSLTVHPDMSLSEEGQEPQFAILNLDDWIIFRCPADVAARLVVLRKRLDSAFWNAIAEPAAGVKSLSDMERHAVETLGSVLQSALKSTNVR